MKKAPHVGTRQRQTTAEENIVRPYCFVSYSSREPHVNLLLPCLWIAFSKHFDVKLTPSALASGASQRSQIIELAKRCEFAVVALDGLRPNVAFEYGLLEAFGRPVILLKEKDAKVDIGSFLGDAVRVAVEAPTLDIDSQFSNVKDVAYVEWSRLKPDETIRILVDEYRKKSSEISRYKEIEPPSLWHT